MGLGGQGGRYYRRVRRGRGAVCELWGVTCRYVVDGNQVQFT